MKSHRWTLVLCAALAASGAGAQEMKPADNPPMSAEERAQKEAWAKIARKAAMEAFQKNTLPSEGHQKLEGMVGTWDAEVTGWMEPGGPPIKSRGTAVNRLVMGGRWVESAFTGDGGFEGLGHTGYDNLKKKYVGTWIDNMSTGVLVSEGTMDAAGKVMTATATMGDPITGTFGPVRMVTTIVTPDEHLVESFGPDPAGKEVKQMEVRYKRRK